MNARCFKLTSYLYICYKYNNFNCTEYKYKWINSEVNISNKKTNLIYKT